MIETKLNNFKFRIMLMFENEKIDSVISKSFRLTEYLFILIQRESQ